MNVIRHFVNGFLIGIANIIPGMSGGTIALVLGIYERLISALHKIGLTTLRSLVSLLTFRKNAYADFKSELRRIDFGFLFLLGIGVIAAVLVLTELLEYLYHKHHEATYGFFFGLVLTSILIPMKLLKGFSWRELLILIIAIALIVCVEEFKKSAASETPNSTEHITVSIWRLVFYFICGAVVISAMILPGVSGSFLLVAFGAYFSLLSTINDLKEDFLTLLKGNVSTYFVENIMILTVFTIGCFIGIIAFTRLINYLLKRYRNLTLAFLIGLMVGSLYSLWPFRETITVGGNPYDTAHLLPSLDRSFLVTASVFLVGCAIILVFYRLEKETE